ncbi:cathepsin L1-like [Anoplophora glabripennis]|uniref:cathepsin L1-like n=1 Tax=Anoplophora glabripennis TaxID=217634 RepID=UPI000873820D|nr:cathepsin L1-like [Anoplophora glabripennis]
MKIFCLILGCLFFSVQGQFGLLGGGIKTLEKVATPVKGLPGVANLEQLEKVFLQDWLDFGTKFNKKYNPVEAPLRKANFLQNIDTITKLATDSVLSFGLKINEFADMLFDEFNELFNGFNRNGQLRRHSQSSKAETFVPTAGESLPESVDWREKGAVSPVKNQQQCAGCWAFSVAGCVEGQNARKTGKLEEASVQHLIDCATGRYDNDGCRGGLTETGFDFVEDNGINSYSDYPYEAVNTSCRSKENTIAKTQGYIRIPEGDEKALAQALAKFGPISTAIHVTKNFQFYGEKIFDDPECRNTPDDLNHALLIVGYGKEADGRKFWLVKNSYGTTWGLDGYFKVAKDEGNKCGIATYARYPKV